MRLLLDSHVLLWWDRDPSKLLGDHHEAISDPGNEIFVSAVTGWELGIKRATGRLVLLDSIGELAQRFGFIELPITMEHGELAASLPLHHKNPFDRMLVAQATAEGLSLVTENAAIRKYAVTCL